MESKHEAQPLPLRLSLLLNTGCCQPFTRNAPVCSYLYGPQGYQNSGRDDLQAPKGKPDQIWAGFVSRLALSLWNRGGAEPGVFSFSSPIAGRLQPVGV